MILIRWKSPLILIPGKVGGHCKGEEGCGILTEALFFVRFDGWTPAEKVMFLYVSHGFHSQMGNHCPPPGV